MEGWIVFATVVTALAGLTAASAAIWLALQNRQLVQASQKEVAVSQEQVRASQEQVRIGQQQLSTQQRPVLVPVGTPVFQEAHDNWLKWEENEQPLALRNMGAGTAFNIAALLCGCATYLHDDPTGTKRSKNLPGNHWTGWLGVPIAAGETEAALLRKGNGTFRQGNDHIGTYSFQAPDEEIPGHTTTKGVLWRIARMTITYKDLSGERYASIFDCVHNRGWHMVDIFPTDRDLHDLEGYYRDVAD